MKRIFRNNKGEVRWGYKLASFLLIQEILAPIAILLLSAGLINLLFPVYHRNDNPECGDVPVLSGGLEIVYVR